MIFDPISSFHKERIQGSRTFRLTVFPSSLMIKAQLHSAHNFRHSSKAISIEGHATFRSGLAAPWPFPCHGTIFHHPVPPWPLYSIIELLLTGSLIHNVNIRISGSIVLRRHGPSSPPEPTGSLHSITWNFSRFGKADWSLPQTSPLLTFVE